MGIDYYSCDFCDEVKSEFDIYYLNEDVDDTYKNNEKLKEIKEKVKILKKYKNGYGRWCGCDVSLHISITVKEYEEYQRLKKLNNNSMCDIC